MTSTIALYISATAFVGTIVALRWARHACRKVDKAAADMKRIMADDERRRSVGTAPQATFDVAKFSRDFQATNLTHPIFGKPSTVHDGAPAAPAVGGTSQSAGAPS